VNRTVWNMRYDGATRLDFDQSEREKKAAKDGNNPGGPAVLPGTYQVTVSAAGHSASESVQVKVDPNQAPAMVAQKAVLQHALAARSGLSALNDMLNRVTAMRATLKQFEANAGDDARYASVLAQAKKLDGELGKFKDSIYAKGVQHDVIEDDLKELSDLHGGMQALAGYGFNSLQGQLPPPALLELEQELEARVGDRISRFNALLAGDVVAYNRAAYAVGAPTVMTGQPVKVTPVSL